MEVQLHRFLTTVLDVVSDQLHAQTAFPPGKEARFILCICYQAGARTGTEVLEYNNIYNIIFIYCNWVVTRWQWLFYM